MKERHPNNIFTKARRFLTGELRPEEKQQILDKLNQDPALVRLAISMSSILSLNPRRPVPEGMSVADVLVLSAAKPLEEASDRILRQLFKLTQTIEQSRQRHISKI